MLKLKLFFLAIIFTALGFAQDSSYYACNTCSNALFLKSEIISENKQVYIVNFNKADNPFRINNKEKDIHCSHCHSHSGYTQEDGTIKIMHSNVHKNGKSYECGICKKPLLDEKELKETTEDAYIFNNTNDADLTIANRSYILNNKQLHCSFCYDKIGKAKKKDKLKIFKKNVLKPQP